MMSLEKKKRLKNSMECLIFPDDRLTMLVSFVLYFKHIIEDNNVSINSTCQWESLLKPYQALLCGLIYYYIRA